MTSLPFVNRLIFVVASVVAIASSAVAQDSKLRRVVLSEEFFSEGATFADVDGDGSNDIISGPFWYAGSDFRARHAYMPVRRFAISGYARHFFSFAHDFNADGHIDILVIPIPGSPAHWFEHPGRASVTDAATWKEHLALDSVGNESPAFVDLTGDGKPELVFINNGAYGYAMADAANPTAVWKFTPVTPNAGYGGFTHGLGVGDVNSDGRLDLLERGGWWEQTEKPGELFRPHAFPFAKSGGSQMFAYDFDGDGDNDVVSVQNAHGWGLSWFEQRRSGDSIGFVPHVILSEQPTETKNGVQFSQMHSLALADIDGDGVQDLVTGKRFYAHGGADPGAHQLQVLYWFRTVRAGDPKNGTDVLRFEPHLIDERMGVGTQLTIGDVDGNGQPDILVGNKLGTSIVLNAEATDAKDLGKPPLTELQRRIGADDFTGVIRKTEALTPEAERASFVLPPGFEIQLVASEPDIAKPMNMAFDARGRLWVTSSEEYPFPAPADRKARDTIKILDDTNGDGRADRITTFADGLNIPMGLYPYKDGVICFSIPDILFLRDTDGDGRADQREKLYGPMGFEKDTHGMCNAFTRGPDGWLYSCHGFNNQTTVAGRDGHQISMTSGNTFRMRLDGSRVEHFTHGMVNPFGMTFDSNGDMFVADCHTKPISLLLHGGYYDSFGKPHDGLGYVPNVMNHLHGSTAIGGIAQYNATSFPPAYRGNTFGGNVMTSRINRNSLHYTGSSIRAEEEPDLLVSGDPWFRPADLQVGPDGALYVTDFYNRIIGHYEIELDHPGRDRLRGRIWRIVFTGKSGGTSLADRRDVSADELAPHSAPDLAALTIEALFEQLSSPNLTVRNLATDRIVDQFGESAVPLARKHFADSTNPFARTHCLWVLHRLNSITSAQLEAAIRDSHEVVRIHGFRVLKEHTTQEASSVDFLKSGFADSSALVKRAAVVAAAHPAQELVKPLIELFGNTPPGDVHLRHAIRMTLRDHLQNADWFRTLEQAVKPEHVELIAEICLALKSAEAGEFLVRYIDQLDATKQADRLAEYMQFAARYVSVETVDKLAATSQQRFANDQKFQLELLQSVREGLQNRGVMLPPSVRGWALRLATDLLGRESGSSTEPLSWTFSQHSDFPDGTNPWTISTRRESADGMQETPLYSSFPLGEKLTGIYRSEPFQLGDSFSFWMAGHDGPPGADVQNKNFVRLRDATTQATLQTWKPPRNDVAQRFEWKPGDAVGRKAYVEIVDGDTGSGYAWLAVGRFSESRLNPSDVVDSRRTAARLAGEFRLTELRESLSTILLKPTTDDESAMKIASALVEMNSDSRLAALALVPGISGSTTKQKQAALRAIVERKADSVQAILSETLLSATTPEQLRIAEQLAAEPVGAALLIALVESGRASAQLLLRPSVSDRLSQSASEKLQAQIKELSRDLPNEDTRLAELIASRKAAYLQAIGSRESGAALFKKSCMNCHQVAGEGKKVGPNLDGIGNRGLDRLVEDILTPNRNVDVAFRSSVVVTDKGKVYSGLIKDVDANEATLLLVDSQGMEISIAKATIDQRVISKLSPMPANLGETLSEQQFRDLLTYVLSLR